MVGGLGTLEGPVIGTVIISVLNEVLKGLGLTYLKNVLIGLIIVTTVLFVPRGLVVVFKPDFWDGLKKRLKARSPPA